MANIPLLLLVVLEICVAAATQVVQYYPAPVPSGKTREYPRTYHKYEGLHFSTRQCREIVSFKNKPLEWCEGECDDLGICTAFNYKEKGGQECSLRACGLNLGVNIPYPIGGTYSGDAAEIGWSGYTFEEIEVGYTYYHGPYKNFFATTQCTYFYPTLDYKNYVLCEEACDDKPGCTGFNFHIHSFNCELRGCSTEDSRPEEYHEDWEGWSKAEINPEPESKCPSQKCLPGNDYTISEFHSYPGLHFADHQCPELRKDQGKSLDSCKGQCDKEQQCTAFNYNPGELNKGQLCSLRKCGLNPSYPEGSGTSWQGYSLKFIEEPHKYYGPYRYWSTSQGCKRIGARLKDKTNILCEEACDIISECNGFNYQNRDCDLQECPYPVTTSNGRPNSPLKGWSKEKIQGENPQTYHKYERLHFSSRQCLEIKSFKSKPHEFCAAKCADLGRCTAFNYNEDGGECSLRACGLNKPYPIGGVYSGVSAQYGWSGYTLRQIPVGYTYYHGPYKNYFGHQTQCRHLIPTLQYKNYVLCEEACDAKHGCTGFNFNIHGFDCELRECSSADSRPGQYEDGWEGWSKAEIKNPEPESKCPSPKCSPIKTRNYVHYDYFHYTTKQCKQIHGTNVGNTLDWCAEECDEVEACTAFNYKQEGGECELRDCRAFPPFPIGIIKGWSGYSKTKVKIGYSRYHGPYGLHFGDHLQDPICPQPGPQLKSQSLVECEDKCDDKHWCTGFNFNIVTFSCELRACSSATTEPVEYLADWESWSTAKITSKPGPNPKCPSIKCSSKSIGIGDDRDAAKHCEHWPHVWWLTCKCDADPWCYHKCKRCQTKQKTAGDIIYELFVPSWAE